VTRAPDFATVATRVRVVLPPAGAMIGAVLLGPIQVNSLILGLGQFGWALLGLLYAGLALGLSAAAHWASRALPGSA